MKKAKILRLPIFLLAVGSLCLAKAVTVRVINEDNGRPLQHQQVTISLLYEKGERAQAKYDAVLSLATDVNGEAQFRLPEPAPAHFSAFVRIDLTRWRCPCFVLASTGNVMQKGIVESAADRRRPRAPVKAVPGDILFIAHPLSFFERLLGYLEQD